jgi:uncharacterized membrane protein
MPVMTHDEFNALLDEPAIVNAIREAEARGTGEVRVLVTHQAVADPLTEARRRFASLGMEKTAQRNGVLIFIAPKSRTFAILGDTGIHERGGQDLWNGVAGALGEGFRAGRWTDALEQAIRLVGDELARHFPRTSAADVNELPDAILRDPRNPRGESGE